MRIHMHGWMSYLATYASFLVIVQLEGVVSPPFRDWLLAPQVLVPGGLLVYFLVRRAYPELLRSRRHVRGSLADIVVGSAIGVLWTAPYILGWLEHPAAAEGFDPTRLAGEQVRGLAMLLRFAGFVLVTPFVEELFVRSALLRYVAGFRTRTDFRWMPLARFEWPGFVATVVYFTCSHALWEWPVALVTGVIFNLWLYHRRDIRATILAHAVANAVVFVVAAFPSAIFSDRTLDLRFFL